MREQVQTALREEMQGLRESVAREAAAVAAATSRASGAEGGAAGAAAGAGSKLKTALRYLLFGGAVFIVAQYLFGRSQAGENGGMSGGGSSGFGSFLSQKMFSAGEQVVSDKTFDDVRGAEEAKADLVEVVEFLRDPDKFSRLGGKLPKGLLLVGPPGTGKTLLAKAVAGEAGVPFFYASGSDFDEMFVGLGARRVRTLFAQARENAPCIVFIDEIDAVAPKRNTTGLNSNRQTVNQLLAELDGFNDSGGVMVIAATNFPQMLDEAVTRPGRFDRQLQVPLPDLAARREILELYLDNSPVDASVDANVIARGTPGASGADLANIVNSAAVAAALDGSDALSQRHLEWAKDKHLMGPERKSAVLREEELRCTAYHETGHALVALKTAGTFPVYKATIMPRGRALGMVSQLPEHDVVSMSKKQLLAKMDVCMGGRVAEVGGQLGAWVPGWLVG